MIDYSKGKIYIIRNKVNNLVYIGSTCSTLDKRFIDHKAKSKIFTHKKLYSDFHKLGLNNFYICLVKNYPCKTKNELLKEEGRLIRKYHNKKRCYNIKIEGRTIKEYKKDNKEKIAKYYKNYAKEYDKLTIRCLVCDCDISLHKKTIHYKSKSHKLKENV